MNIFIKEQLINKNYNLTTQEIIFMREMKEKMKVLYQVVGK